MNDGLRKSKANWKSTLFGIGWVIAIIVAVYFLIRPEPVIPLPAGWTIWPETGASRTILPGDDIVYVGGVKGLYIIDSSDNAARVNIPGASGAEIVNAVLEDRNGALWVCMDEGLAIRKDRSGNGSEILAPQEGIRFRSFSRSSFQGGSCQASIPGQRW